MSSRWCQYGLFVLRLLPGNETRKGAHTGEPLQSSGYSPIGNGKNMPPGLGTGRGAFDGETAGKALATVCLGSIVQWGGHPSPLSAMDLVGSMGQACRLSMTGKMLLPSRPRQSLGTREVNVTRTGAAVASRHPRRAFPPQSPR